MEYIYTSGRVVAMHCERCKAVVWVPAQEMRQNPAPVTCGDCLQFLSQNPDVADAEFQMAIKRSQQDSIDMRARWAAQDAERSR